MPRKPRGGTNGRPPKFARGTPMTAYGIRLPAAWLEAIRSQARELECTTRDLMLWRLRHPGEPLPDLDLRPAWFARRPSADK